MQQPEPYVVGMDPSLTSSGVTRLGGVTDSRTFGRRGLTLLKLADRIDAIKELSHQVVDAACDMRAPGGGWRPGPARPALVLIEAPDVSNSYGGLVERVSLIYQTTQILLGLGVPVGWVPSAVLKGYATGKGSPGRGGGDAGTKVGVRQVVLELWPELGIDKTKPKQSQYDQADSAILAAMALDVLGLGRRVPDAQADEWLFRGSIEYPPPVLEPHCPASGAGV